MEYSLLIFSAVPGAAAPQQGGSGGGGGGGLAVALLRGFCGGEGPRLGGAQLLREGREAGRVPKARPKTQGPRETQEPDDF